MGQEFAALQPIRKSNPTPAFNCDFLESTEITSALAWVKSPPRQITIALNNKLVAQSSTVLFSISSAFSLVHIQHLRNYLSSIPALTNLLCGILIAPCYLR